MGGSVRISSRLVRLLSAASMAGVVPWAAPVPASAECDGPYPSFRRSAPTAVRVLVGDVVAPLGRLDPDGRSRTFTLRVQHVVHGAASATIAIRDLPTQPCAPPLLARQGDRIALAFEGKDFDPPTTVNAPAWIHGEPPGDLTAETITLAEVYELFGLDPPDTGTEGGEEGRPSSEQGPAEVLVLVLLLLVVGASAAIASRRRSGLDRGAR